MDRRKTQIVEVLNELFKPRAILERSDIPSRKFEGLDTPATVSSDDLPSPSGRGVGGEGQTGTTPQPPATLLTGSAPAEAVPVRLNGLTFQTDLTAGHK